MTASKYFRITTQVYYKNTLDNLHSCSTVINMAHVLSRNKQIAVVGALAEGSSIRFIERITGINRNTIMSLGVRVGRRCTGLLDAKDARSALPLYVVR
jgi:hypothetical protein